MKLQNLRRTSQIFSLILVVLIPILSSYRILLTYFPPEHIGELLSNLNDYSNITLVTKGGFLYPLVVGLDSTLGNFFRTFGTLMWFSDLFGSYYWSIKFLGLYFFDPLSLFQFLYSYHPLTVSFFVAILTPILLAVIFGRIFCSWICPINTIMEFNRYLLKKLKIKPRKMVLISNHYIRFIVLIIGIALTSAGIVIFPYILPYSMLGRLIAYLALGTIFWFGIIYLLSILIMDAFIQKGLWCNYLCPTGALLNILGRIKIVRPKRNELLCKTDCLLCSKVCSWNANPKNNDLKNCTNCHLCSERCPSKAISYIPLTGTAHKDYPLS